MWVRHEPMPYKNHEVHKKYQREWARRKRKGEPTRLTESFTPEQRKKGRQKAQERYREKQKKRMIETFPNECTICGGIINLCLHRIDFKPHARRKSLYLKNPEMYIRFCYACHKGVHFAHERMGLSWEQIRELLSI